MFQTNRRFKDQLVKAEWVENARKKQYQDLVQQLRINDEKKMMIKEIQEHQTQQKLATAFAQRRRVETDEGQQLYDRSHTPLLIKEAAIK